MNGKTASALAARIVEQLQRGDAAGAEVQARKLRETLPEDAELARLHGVALLMLGRGSEARTALQDALRIDPANADAMSNLASAMLADAWATALTVLGPQQGLALANAHGLAARFVSRHRDGPHEHLSTAFAALLEDTATEKPA